MTAVVLTWQLHCSELSFLNPRLYKIQTEGGLWEAGGSQLHMCYFLYLTVQVSGWNKEYLNLLT